jgi:protein-S-isoprenylcysteine O-methyltransferase Ste14
MSLMNEFAKSGESLFRWRSYWPLVFVAFLLLVLSDFRYLGNSEALDHAWEILCLAVSGIGIALRVATVGFVPANTSGRNTVAQKADSLNTSGMYSVVRHPLYLGNFFVVLGVALFPHQWWVVVIYVLVFCIYYERIMFAEEAFLGGRFGAEFEEWAGRTPAFVPRLTGWRRPELSFAWKAVLSREHSTILGAVVIFTLCEVVGDWFVGEPLHIDPGWMGLFVGSLGLSLVTRWLKRRGLLRVPGH